MTRPRASRIALALAVAAAACQNAPRPAPAAHSSLGVGVAARVADIDVPARLVADVALSRRVVPEAAVDLLVDDAVLAASAARAQVSARPEVKASLTAVRARATVDRVRSEATTGPVTDEELRELTEAHWTEVDAPETVRVVHAVARHPVTPDAQRDAAARAVAAAVALAVADATDEADFQRRAKATPHPGVELVVQPLDPFTADGRVAVPGDPPPYDRRFAQAAAALPTPGATSGVIESSAGWHVIRLVARNPAIHLPEGERRRMFLEEVRAKRGYEALNVVESAARARAPVELANGLDDLLAEALPAVRTPPPAPPTPAP